MIRIANAGGYWGDDPGALRRQLEGGHVDYITIDFLAEITMSIMQKQRSRSPDLGYARDFIEMLKDVFPLLMKKKTCLITNAGGVNPMACAGRIFELASSLGLTPKIAVVSGDDILEQLPSLTAQCAFQNMETQESFDRVQDRIKAANIYFGASAVVEALSHQPDIVITGRVTDTGITLAPMMARYGWTDWNRLASGIVASHIIECGSQACGGNFTDWHKVDRFHNIGYPIIEVLEDGTFFVTKHPNTGGLVSVDTIREQLFYEMGDPKAYITPDVVADFSSIHLESDGDHRVKVSGIQGFEPTPFYKVSMAYEDGFKTTGSILISGPHARAKAECFADIFWKRVDGRFLDQSTEYFGWNACHKNLEPAEDGNEILLRLGATSLYQEDLNRFSKLIPSLILSGPPGVAVTGGVAKPQEIMSYWPALMPKTLVYPRVRILENGKEVIDTQVLDIPQGQFQAAEHRHVQVASTVGRPNAKSSGAHSLFEIALARSGDKGDAANIGLLARSEKAYEFLKSAVTAQWVKDLFWQHCQGKVIRYEVPNMLGFNFILESSLGGGGTQTLRVDAQGKTYAQALLRQRLDIPKDVLDSIIQSQVRG